MFACIYIPDFPVAAIVRAEPLLRDCAVAVLEGKPPQVRVAALNDKARILGMEIGMTKLQAAIFSVAEEEDKVAAKTSTEKKSSQIELASHHAKRQTKLPAAILRQRSPAQEKSSHAALLDVAMHSPRGWRTRIPTACCLTSMAWSGSVAQPPPWHKNSLRA